MMTVTNLLLINYLTDQWSVFCTTCFVTYTVVYYNLDVFCIFNGIPQILYVTFGVHFVWFAGFIYDKTNNYDIPFYMGGIVEVLGGTLVIIAVIVKRVST